MEYILTIGKYLPITYVRVINKIHKINFDDIYNQKFSSIKVNIKIYDSIFNLVCDTNIYRKIIGKYNIDKYVIQFSYVKKQMNIVIYDTEMENFLLKKDKKYINIDKGLFIRYYHYASFNFWFSCSKEQIIEWYYYYNRDKAYDLNINKYKLFIEYFDLPNRYISTIHKRNRVLNEKQIDLRSYPPLSALPLWGNAADMNVRSGCLKENNRIKSSTRGQADIFSYIMMDENIILYNNIKYINNMTQQLYYYDTIIEVQKFFGVDSSEIYDINCDKSYLLISNMIGYFVYYRYDIRLYIMINILKSLNINFMINISAIIAYLIDFNILTWKELKYYTYKDCEIMIIYLR